jgi:alpha-glucosidase/alpha-D-xyloside xylohydrolase
MRALWIYYPHDPKATATEDAYMWGTSILVAPVKEKGLSQRKTYLPQGQWWDFWTQTKIDGGKEVTRDVDLETLPLYIKAGAILPMGPVKQYEDDGISYDYERGDFSRIECIWSDKDRTLSLKPMHTPKKPVSHGAVVVEVVGTSGNKAITLDGHPLVVKL